MVIFHSYVSLAEGSVSWDSKRILLLIGYFSGVIKHGRCEIHERNGSKCCWGIFQQSRGHGADDTRGVVRSS